jgi:cytochrome c5
MDSNRLYSVVAVILILGGIGIISARMYEKHWRHGGMMGMMGGGMMGGDDMKEMMRGMMKGKLPAGVEPEDLPAPESAGAKLTARFCGQCHSLPSPSMHTAKEWPKVADRMFRRLDRMSGMGMMMHMEFPYGSDKKTILAYLAEHALRPMDKDNLPEPDSVGAAAFGKVCSECHGLPDITVHTKDEWPGVVEKMESNMKEMNKKPPTAAEKSAIVEYLVRNGPADED